MSYHKQTRIEDFINVLKEIGEQATSKETIIQLKIKLEKSAAFKDDPDFVMNLLNLSVEGRQTKAEHQRQIGQQEDVRGEWENQPPKTEKSSISERRAGNNREDSVWKQDEALD
ncbi:hypothetical protein TNCV_3032501 [Trichonephila clavipes]|nr:hypothetical protein TNCV_3032501 [Trichonephila clavipes]